MQLSIKQIYDLVSGVQINEAEPKNGRKFYEKYINPAYKKNVIEGSVFENSYTAAVGDYHREGFYKGFKAAVQLIMSCYN